MIKIDNKTPFITEIYPIQDKEGNDLLLILFKATYSLKSGQPQKAEKQEPVEPADLYYGEPGKSSLKYSSDISFDKKASDIALKGEALAPFEGARESTLYFKVGEVEKRIAVFGDRHWILAPIGHMISKPEPFDKIPLVYERAFGGFDKSHEKEKHHQAFESNPLGVGFRAKKSNLETDGFPLPNFEDLDDLIVSLKDKPKVAGLGFISPNWQPRLKKSGTFDQNWMENRMPLLPKDFDPAFFNSAHPDLIYPGFLKGNEEVILSGFSPEPFKFNLPYDLPFCQLEIGGEKQEIELKTDKLFIDTKEELLILLFSASLSSDQEFKEFGPLEIKLKPKD